MGLFLKFPQLLLRRWTLFFLFLCFFWKKRSKTNPPRSLRHFQDNFAGVSSFDGRKMTFVVAASKLWTCWDSPILTLDISVNIIHLTSDSKDINLARALLVSAPYKRMGLKVTVGDSNEEREKTSQERSMFFFRFFGDFNKSEGEDSKMTDAALLSWVSGMCIQSLSFRNVGCPPAAFLIIPQ